jgi:hypothetical protein
LEIIVNDEKIDFTLEDENCLGEVVTALESWLSKSNLVVTSITLGSRNLNRHDQDLTEEPEEQWQGMPLDQIERIVITAKLLKEIQFSNIQAVLTYLDLLKVALEKQDKRYLDDLLTGREDTFKLLNMLYRPSSNPIAGQEIKDLENLLSGSSRDTILAWPIGVQTRALGIISKLIELLSSRLEEIKNPLAVLSSATRELEGTATNIREVSVLLQTGQEQTAMAMIIGFADLSQTLLRVLSNLEETSTISLKKLKIGEESAGRFFADFNGILRELIGAFDTKDTVLIGDLLEYEVAPRIELFLNFLNEVQNIQSRRP